MHSFMHNSIKMSDKEKATFKTFTVEHLLEKDEKAGQENNLVKTSNLQQEKDELKMASQSTTIFNALPKNTCNSQALNLAERLAGDFHFPSTYFMALLL